MPRLTSGGKIRSSFDLQPSESVPSQKLQFAYLEALGKHDVGLGE